MLSKAWCSSKVNLKLVQCLSRPISTIIRFPKCAPTSFVNLLINNDISKPHMYIPSHKNYRSMCTSSKQSQLSGRSSLFSFNKYTIFISCFAGFLGLMGLGYYAIQSPMFLTIMGGVLAFSGSAIIIFYLKYTKAKGLLHSTIQKALEKHRFDIQKSIGNFNIPPVNMFSVESLSIPGPTGNEIPVLRCIAEIHGNFGKSLLRAVAVKNKIGFFSYDVEIRKLTLINANFLTQVEKEITLIDNPPKVNFVDSIRYEKISSDRYGSMKFSRRKSLKLQAEFDKDIKSYMKTEVETATKK